MNGPASVPVYLNAPKSGSVWERVPEVSAFVNTSEYKSIYEPCVAVTYSYARWFNFVMASQAVIWAVVLVSILHPDVLFRNAAGMDVSLCHISMYLGDAGCQSCYAFE